MNRQAFISLTLALALSYTTAGLGAALTDLGPWYFALRQPEWKPPDPAFGVIWTTIFTLCATEPSPLPFAAAEPFFLCFP